MSSGSPRPRPQGRRAAAFERGWVDSLNGYFNLVNQSIEDSFDYRRGWDECATYRWADPINRGVAPDPTFRPIDAALGGTP